MVHYIKIRTPFFFFFSFKSKCVQVFSISSALRAIYLSLTRNSKETRRDHIVKKKKIIKKNSPYILWRGREEFKVREFLNYDNTIINQTTIDDSKHLSNDACTNGNSKARN